MIEDKKKYFVDMVFQNISIILKICNIYCNSDDRDDMKQEIIYQLWKSFHSWKGNAKFQTWMYRVALNTALLSLRKKKPGCSQFSSDDYQIPDPASEEYEMESQVKLLYRCIAKLNDLEKALIFLYIEKCPYNEISEITGISEKAVSVRLVRIREKLKKSCNTLKLIYDGE